MLLRSSLLTAPHGFATRLGGVSEGPFASLNLGAAVGDVVAHVAENRARLAALAGVTVDSLFIASQVHGDAVVWAPDTSTARVPPTAPRPTEADAVGSSVPGTAVAISTADCVPILLSDRDGRHVVAVHSGWKGTELRIVARAVEALKRERGVEAGSVVAAIGPCIRVCCYEVSEDVASRFRHGFGADVVRESGEGKPHLNLAAAVAHTLASAGVPTTSIDVLDACTACDAERFFSHRRDRGVTGRHFSFITCR